MSPTEGDVLRAVFFPHEMEPEPLLVPFGQLITGVVLSCPQEELCVGTLSGFGAKRGHGTAAGER